jgi:hypothetical protein
MKTSTVTKDQFVAVLNAAGITDARKQKLHAAFEQQHPEAHQSFLEYLGVSADQIAKIRAGSRQA